LLRRAGLAVAVVIWGAAGAPAALAAAGGQETNDPWEGYNRKAFAFNDFFDRWLLKPVVKGYKFIAPAPVETGISNAFENLLEPASVLNDILQWKWKAAGRDLGRFVVNSTAGVVGLWDVADMMGWKKPTSSEDFGQTLRTWGVPTGPYFVIPFLGPSTLTEAFVATPVDFFTHPVSYTESVRAYNSLSALKIIDKRSQLLAAEELISGDRYIFIREGFLQNRAFNAADGQVIDDFGADTDLKDF
ncbi:MAG TPA: VacJ family lipoprotein, partial [Cellvibrionaceae bacterium]|nr:VacJ family lipoprotein [Cellvibrionaceae bacterium]